MVFKKSDFNPITPSDRREIIQLEEKIDECLANGNKFVHLEKEYNYVVKKEIERMYLEAGWYSVTFEDFYDQRDNLGDSHCIRFE